MSSEFHYLLKFIVVGDTGMAFNKYRSWEVLCCHAIYRTENK